MELMEFCLSLLGFLNLAVVSLQWWLSLKFPINLSVWYVSVLILALSKTGCFIWGFLDASIFDGDRIVGQFPFYFVFLKVFLREILFIFMSEFLFFLFFFFYLKSDLKEGCTSFILDINFFRSFSDPVRVKYMTSI